MLEVCLQNYAHNLFRHTNEGQRHFILVVYCSSPDELYYEIRLAYEKETNGRYERLSVSGGWVRTQPYIQRTGSALGKDAPGSLIHNPAAAYACGSFL